MARHVLQGEFPVFFWGQAYKGVPEVYAAALVFRAAGSSVLALQAVTLAIFAAFVGLQFLLIRETFSTPIALLTSLFVIVAPPALVYWSIVGLAEIAITLLAGTVMLYAAVRWRATGSMLALAWLAFACGFALVGAAVRALLRGRPRAHPLDRRSAPGGARCSTSRAEGDCRSRPLRRCHPADACPGSTCCSASTRFSLGDSPARSPASRYGPTIRRRCGRSRRCSLLSPPCRRGG